MSLGLAVFRALRRAATDLDALRAGCRPGSPAWVALTELVLALDALITALVEGEPIDGDDDGCGQPHAVCAVPRARDGG